MLSIVTSQAIPGGSGVTLLARIVGQTGIPITKASLASIAWTLTDLTTTLAVASGTFTVSTSVFDSLQVTSPLWTVDASGYNFLGTIPAANVTPSGDRFEARVTFTPTSGQAFVVIFQFQTV